MMSQKQNSVSFDVKPKCLSELDRLRFANQCAIQKKLDFRNAEYWATGRKTLVEGHTFFYCKSFEPIRWQQLDYEKFLDVLNAVDMCDAVQRSFAGITNKAGITEDGAPNLLRFVDRKSKDAHRFRTRFSSAA
jgi:uncharacterized protein YfbU (UPF0304 family)